MGLEKSPLVTRFVAATAVDPAQIAVAAIAPYKKMFAIVTPLFIDYRKERSHSTPVESISSTLSWTMIIKYNYQVAILFYCCQGKGTGDGERAPRPECWLVDNEAGGGAEWGTPVGYDGGPLTGGRVVADCALNGTCDLRSGLTGSFARETATIPEPPP